MQCHLHKLLNLRLYFQVCILSLYAAVVLEELYMEYKDKGRPFCNVLLDAKSAFDVMVLLMLMRKIYLVGVHLSTRTIIEELHTWMKTFFCI
jgi:hypothetical protein